LNGLNVLELLNAITPLSRQAVFEEMDRARKKYPEPFDNGKALTALISSAARRCNLQIAHLIWEWMDVANIKKNTFHYNSMISATEKSKNFRDALQLMREMETKKIPKNEAT
jgi:pentatricopeptide repeat protein